MRLGASKEAVAGWRSVVAHPIPELARELEKRFAEATLTMPPRVIRIVGPAAVADFFSTVPADKRLDHG